MNQKIKLIITIFFVVFFFTILIIIKGFYPLISLKVSSKAGLVGIKNNTPALIDKITYHFHKPQRGELVIYQCPQHRPSTYFQRFDSLTNNGIYVRGDTWPPEAPSIFVPKNNIIGRVIIISSPLAQFYFLIFLLLPICFFFSLLYLLQIFKKKPFRWKNYLKAFLWWLFFLIILDSPLIISVDLFVHLFNPNYLEFYKNPPDWYFITPKAISYLAALLATLLAIWRFFIYLRKEEK
ncbi:MAG: hypothetical protein ACP5OX_02785 [Minisyncoccia bacterium]